MVQLGNDILDILKAPFVGELDLIHLFLLVGIILIFIGIWALILNHIHIAAMGA